MMIINKANQESFGLPSMNGFASSENTSAEL